MTIHSIILAFSLVVALTVVSNQAHTIKSLRTAVADRDFALDITADAINIQQGMLDNRRRHIADLNTALSECMDAPPRQ